MLIAKNISKTYPNGVQALKDVTLTVEQGEIVGLVGLNGAGKTTFVKIAVGVLEKDSGEISICGYQPISEQKKLSKMIAWIPQEGTRKLSTWLSGWDNIRYYCMNRGLSKQEIDKRIDNLLNIITHDRSFLKKQISIMSGGQRQLCNILIGLVPDSSFLFCDEISVSVDVRITNNIYNYLKEYVEHGGSILLTSQNLKEIETLSDRVALLYNGKIIDIDSPRRLSKKILEYELIEMVFESPINENAKFQEFLTELQNIAKSEIQVLSHKKLRIRCQNAHSILPDISLLLNKYRLYPLLEVGKPNLQDALQRLMEAEQK